MINALSTHVAILDETGTIIAVNNAWQRFGEENGLQTPHSGVGSNYLTLCDNITGESRTEAARIAQTIRSLLDGMGQGADIEYACHRVAEQRWFVAHITAIEVENNQRYIFVAHENITKQKQIEIAEQLQYQANLLDHVSDAIIATDLGFRITSWNAAAEHIYGWQADEVMGHSATEILASVYQGVAAAQVRQQFLEQGNWHGEIIQNRKDRTPVYIMSSVTLLKNTAGQPVGAVAVNRDITEQKQAEIAQQAQLKLQDQLTKIAATVPGMICAFQLHPNGTVTMPFASAALDEIYGLSYEAIAQDANHIFNQIHPNDLPQVQASIAKSAQTMTPWYAEYRFRHPRKGERWLEGHSVPERESDGSILWHGYIHDITERKEAELAIQKRNEELRLLHDASQRLNRSLDPDEVYQTIHEFLSAVLPMDSLIISSYDEETELITCQAFWSQDQRLDVSHFPTIPLEPEGQGTQSIAIRTGETLLINDYLTQVRTARKLYYVDDQTYELQESVPDDVAVTRSALIAPLKVSGRVRGVIQVLSYQHNAYTPNQLRLLEALALHIASAQLNASLFAQVEAELHERQQAELALRESETWLRLAHDAANLGTWQYDLATELVHFDASGREHYDLTSSAIPLTQLLTYFHPEDQVRIQQELAAAIQADGHNRFSTEFRVIHDDGSTRWLSVQANIHYKDEGEPKLPYLIVGVSRDITEHKLAEESLQKQRQHFLDLFENSPMATWLENYTDVMAWMDELKSQGVTNLRTFLAENPAQIDHAFSLIRVVDVNWAAVEQNAAQNKAHLIAHLSKLLSKEAQPDLIQELVALWQGRNRVEFELNGLRLDGQPLTVIINLYVPAYQGKPDYSRVILTSTEITQLKQAQKALLESETHYRELADSITDIFVELDTELRFISWNKPAEQISGIMANQAVGKSVVEMFGTSAPVQKSLTHLHEVLRTQQPTTYVVEFPIHDYMYSFDISIYPTRHGLSALAKDITVQEKARHRLRESEARLGNIVNSAMDAIITVDEDHRILLFNKAAEQIFRCSSAEVLGQPLERFIPARFRNKHKADVRKFGETDVTNRAMGRLGTQTALRAQGEEFPIEASISHTEIEGKQVFTVILRDVTERRLMEEALTDERERLALRVEERTADLQRANMELARASRLKDEFLSSMSHELRTPLNAILILSESMEEGVYGNLNAKQVETLHTVIESGQHLLALINDILDLSKIEAGKLEMQWSGVNVEELCAAAIRLIREPAHKKQQQITVTLENHTNVIQADERRLKQVLVNLLSNAVKFTSDKGAIGLTVSDDPAGEMIHFTVWDTGIGIDPAHISKLFQPFVQLDSSLSRRYGGTGLGLALVDRLVKAHNGMIAVESKPNEGSRFTFSLPILLPQLMPEAAAATAPRLTPYHLPENTASPLVLVVDDNPISSDGLIDYLEYEGYRSIVAHNGREALAQAQTSEPDLIMMDIQMPGMDGLEVIRRLRLLPKFATTPILALTALVMPGDRERCLAAGATHYITKPIDLKALSELLQAVLIR